MNFFNAELLLENGGYEVLVCGTRFPLPKGKQDRLREKGTAAQDITLGVRPEHIALANGGVPSIAAVVEVSELMGSTVHLHVDAGGSPTVVIASTVDLPEGARAGFPSGTQISITFGGSEAHLFSKEDESNLI
jgi:multiple sugar transport system ATP-binding protein